MSFHWRIFLLAGAVATAPPPGRATPPTGPADELQLHEMRADEHRHEAAIHAAAARPGRASVEFLLRELTWLSARDPQHEQFLTQLVKEKLVKSYRPAVDRFRPTADPAPHPETLAQWADWWKTTAPTLNDDLSPRQVPVDVERYVDSDFAEDPKKVTLSAEVDASEYRVGDPVRLTLRMRNTSDRPQRLYLPFVPSGWYPTMAYGVRLTRDRNPLIDLAASDYYVGSYSGPPDWHVLAPGETFEDSVCFQHWLQHVIDLPLPEGAYELTVTFDPSRFAGIRRNGGGSLHPWEAAPVRFRIRGAPRRDPGEILKLVAQKAGLKWLHEDLHGERSDRRDVVWRAIHEYGDSRLRPFLEEFEKDEPDKRYHWSRPEHLRPFEKERDTWRQ